MNIVIRIFTSTAVMVVAHYASRIVINTINKEPRPVAQAFHR